MRLPSQKFSVSGLPIHGKDWHHEPQLSMADARAPSHLSERSLLREGSGLAYMPVWRGMSFVHEFRAVVHGPIALTCAALTLPTNCRVPILHRRQLDGHVAAGPVDPACPGRRRIASTWEITPRNIGHSPPPPRAREFGMSTAMWCPSAMGTEPSTRPLLRRPPRCPRHRRE